MNEMICVEIVAQITPTIPSPKYFANNIDNGIFKRAALEPIIICSLILPLPLITCIKIELNVCIKTKNAQAKQRLNGISIESPIQT